MNRNMGMSDRVLRAVVAVIFAILYFGGFVSAGIATGLLIVAVMFLITSTVGFCPLYTFFGIRTDKKES